MLQVAQKMGVPACNLKTLVEYVRGENDSEGRTGRERVLHRIATHFGVSRGWAKVSVLRILNGGSIQKWIADAECQRGRDEPQAELASSELLRSLVDAPDARAELEITARGRKENLLDVCS